MKIVIIPANIGKAAIDGNQEILNKATKSVMDFLDRNNYKYEAVQYNFTLPLRPVGFGFEVPDTWNKLAVAEQYCLDGWFFKVINNRLEKW